MKPSGRELAIAKTLLAMWPHLKGYGEMLEQKIRTKALGSFDSPIRTEKIMERIIDLTVKRHTIANLQKEIDRAIARLPEVTGKVLLNYYGVGNNPRPIKDMAEEHGMSERSFFRKLDSSITELAAQLETMGINAFTWANLVTNHEWIKDAFAREQSGNHRRRS